MEHLRDLGAVHLEGCALTIGSFDGVHRGHQALIGELVSAADQLALPAVVVTFYPHPSVVLRQREPAFYITTPEEKAVLLGESGVDYVITLTFDEQLSKVEAPAFLDQLSQHLGFRSLLAGEDFALGFQRRGNRHFLKQAGAERGFDLQIIPPYMLEGEVVSSTRVREALRSGDVARVGIYLGRRFALPGKVVLGAGRGKELGIPTANLSLWRERAYPGNGVYACIAEHGSNSWEAVVNIGARPTFEGAAADVTVEAHLLDFPGGDLYDQELRLVFVDRLRDERPFSGPDALLKQVQRDILRAREILSAD